MIAELNLQDRTVADELWLLQHTAYRLEAELIGFNEIPPLLETVDMLQNCGETFYACYGNDDELIGAVAVQEETPGTLTVTRMMVHPGHFRQGIAGRLLRYVFTVYDGMGEFRVSTGSKNAPAVALYTKNGFIPCGRQEVAPGVELVEFHRQGRAD